MKKEIKKSVKVYAVIQRVLEGTILFAIILRILSMLVLVCAGSGYLIYRRAKKRKNVNLLRDEALAEMDERGEMINGKAAMVSFVVVMFVLLIGSLVMHTLGHFVIFGVLFGTVVFGAGVWFAVGAYYKGRM